MLLAADVAVQLRMSSILTLSGALLDCIAFGVPTVVTQSMVDEIGAPGYVTAIPDRISPLLIAEAVVSSARLRDPTWKKSSANAAAISRRIWQANMRANCWPPCILRRNDSMTQAPVLIDLSQFVRAPARSGIQRVLVELISGWPLDDLQACVGYLDGGQYGIVGLETAKTVLKQHFAADIGSAEPGESAGEIRRRSGRAPSRSFPRTRSWSGLPPISFPSRRSTTTFWT